MLIKFHNLYSGGYGALSSYPTLTIKQIDQGGARRLSSLPVCEYFFLRLLLQLYDYDPSK